MLAWCVLYLYTAPEAVFTQTPFWAEAIFSKEKESPSMPRTIYSSGVVYKDFSVCCTWGLMITMSFLTTGNSSPSAIKEPVPFTT